MKKIETYTDAELVVMVRSTLVAWVGAASLFFLADILRHLYFDLPGEDRLIGLTGAFFTCAGIFLIFYEKSDFRFDRRTRTLTWSRQRGFSKRSGTLPFAAINKVILQSCLGNTKDYPKHRVVLMTPEGELPLMVAYEHDDMNGIIAERVSGVLELGSKSVVAESVESLVAKGRDVDAIRLLREKTGLSLTEAHEQIELMRSKRGKPEQ